MRLLICAGGTGGGVYPALAVLRALGNKADPVLWVGGKGGMEADLVTRAGVPYTSIPSAGVHGVGPRQLPRNVWQLCQGFLEARKIVRRFQPEAMLFTGGYVGVPVALAAAVTPAPRATRKRISLVYVPDIEPGLALRTISRFADQIALTTEESRRYFHQREQIVVTGYPSRPELVGWDRTSALRTLGLRDDLPTILIFGGSKGAVTLNEPIFPLLPQILKRAQVIHLTGQVDWERIPLIQSLLPAEVLERYHPSAYLHDMGAALASADLAICRAGASTLGELPLFGLPAILVPYPFAWQYQKTNAQYLEKRSAAVMIENDQLANQLLSTLVNILDDPNRIAAMRTAMRNLAHPDAANQVAALLGEDASLDFRGR